jgi:hypothetical protein
MKLILEFDDFNPKNTVNCIESIDKLVSLFPKIKLTMFTSALYERKALFSDKVWCDRVRAHINNNNLRLAVHGLYHTQEEFKHKSYDDAKLSLVIAESVFNVSNLPFIKVFRGPHWGINDNTYNALIDLNYKFVFTHESYKDLSVRFPNIKSVYYNWNIKDDFNLIETTDFIIGHGHTHNVCGNGIEESYSKIRKFIDTYNPIFKFADEFYEKN